MHIRELEVADILLSEIESTYPGRIQNRVIQSQRAIQPPEFAQYPLQQNPFGHMHYPQAPLVVTEQYPGAMCAQPVQPVPAGNGMLTINEPQNPGRAFTPRNPRAPHLPPSPIANIPGSSTFVMPHPHPHPQPHPGPLYRGDPRNGGPPAGYDPVFHRFQYF